MRIVEGSAFIAAPSGGMTLSQLGADVIRFDQIGGGIDYRRWPVTDGGKSLYWHSLNKGKRSIAIDLRSSAGRELIQNIITASGEENGLFITNFPAKGFLADEILRAKRHDLIYVNLTGDRNGGSALDYTVNSKVGLPYLTGDGKKPINNPFPSWDVIAGQQIAIALLAAERHRRKTEEGQFVKLALADVALATMGHLGFIAEAQINGEARKPVANHIYGTFGHDFECKDGHRVMVVGVSPNQWRALVKATQSEDKIISLEEELKLDFSIEGDRFKARERIQGIFSLWFISNCFMEVKRALDEERVCWGPYQSISGLVSNDSDCSTENPLFSLVDQPGIGEYLVPSQPIYFTGLDSEPANPAPLLGQHTDEILSEILCLGSLEIGKLHDAKIIAGPES
jgi:2-methylfumaryl-CoA isomerase